MTALPTIRDAAADQQFQLAVREQFPKSYEFEARYVEHEISHIGRVFATGLCPVDGKDVLEFGCCIGATSIVLAHYGARDSRRHKSGESRDGLPEFETLWQPGNSL